MDTFESGFDYSIDIEGSRQGAEARIYLCTYLGRPAILKERFEKKYRHHVVDKRLNKSRLRNELKGIVKAQQVGVDTPAVFFVDNEKNCIIMEQIKGCTVKDWIEHRRNNVNDVQSFQSEVRAFGRILGIAIAKMHGGNLIHGDLTTSNVLLRDNDPSRPVFIDFGLSLQGKITSEEKGVDLYVLERAMASTHLDSTEMFTGVLEGYTENNSKQSTSVLRKLDEIRLRGRKRDMVG